MPTRPIATLLERIQKLLDMSQSATELGNTKEAEAFAAKVQQLLLKHHLNMSAVEAATETRNDPVDHSTIDISPQYRRANPPKKCAKWQSFLARVVAQAHLCDAATLYGFPVFVFAGRKQDRDVAQWVFERLVGLALHASHRSYQEARKDGCRHPGYKTSFREAFAVRITQRYEAEEERIRRAKNIKTTALVRLDTARASAVAHLAEVGATVVPPKESTRVRDWEAALAGANAANDAPLHGNALDAPTQARLSHA